MSSSAYPIIWSMKHAPVTDAIERAILFALSDFGDPDGCDCFPSVPTVAKVAMTSERTVQRKCAEMAKRGLIRHQPGPPPARWLKLPADKRPTVWEVMIPCSWWSPSQLEEVNRMREQRGREPITPESRPDIAPAPAKASRSDKGKPNPKRSRPKKTPPAPENTPQEPAPAGSLERGDTETPLWTTERGDTETPGGVTQRHLAGCLEDTQPSCVHPPVSPSLENPPASAGTAARLGDARACEAPSANEEDHREEKPGPGPAAWGVVNSLPPGMLADTTGRRSWVRGAMAREIQGMLDAGMRPGAIVRHADRLQLDAEFDHVQVLRGLRKDLGLLLYRGEVCEDCGMFLPELRAACPQCVPAAYPPDDEVIDPEIIARFTAHLGASA